MNNIRNLMLVDDDEIYLFLAKKAVKDANITQNILEFHNGKDAISFLSSNANATDTLPELIFLDLAMPVMDGWGFLEEYAAIKHNLSKQIVIYVVSSSISPDDIERAKNFSSVTDYIIKPITKDVYIEIVNQIHFKS